jgi:hypothetical protein
MELPLGRSLPASATLGYLHSASSGGDEGIFLSSIEAIYVTPGTSETIYATPGKSETTYVSLVKNWCDKYQRSARAVKRL